MIDFTTALDRPCPFCGAAPGVGCTSLGGAPIESDPPVHKQRAFVATTLGRRSAGKTSKATHVRHPWSAFRGLCGVNLVALDVQGRAPDATCRDCRIIAAYLADHPDVEPPRQPIVGDPVRPPASIADILRRSSPGVIPTVDDGVTTSVTTPGRTG